MAKRIPFKRLEPWQDPKVKPLIQIENISKSYNGILAVNNLNLLIYKHEFFSILGGSGCGKTTILRLISGFEKPTSGRIYIDGTDITDRPPYERPVNMMFQSYALFPHMTVQENIAFGLKQSHLPKGEMNHRLDKVLELLQLKDYAKRLPDQLSGGQKQRTALARSLVKQPKVLLLDEPLAALDKKLREKTQFELVNIQESLGVTFVMVTHDQEEAMTMSTRISVMEEGRIRQVGTPTEVYEFPNSVFVADFIGSINIFEGFVMEDEPDHVVVKSGEIESELYVGHSASAPIGSHVHIAIRPEKIFISLDDPEKERNCTKGIVKEIGYLGDVSIYHVRLESGKIVLATIQNQFRQAEHAVAWDDEVYLYWNSDGCLLLTY